MQRVRKFFVGFSTTALILMVFAGYCISIVGVVEGPWWEALGGLLLICVSAGLLCAIS